MKLTIEQLELLLDQFPNSTNALQIEIALQGARVDAGLCIVCGEKDYYLRNKCYSCFEQEKADE